MEKVELVFDPDNTRAAEYVGDRLSMFNSSRTGKSDYYPCKIFLKGEKGETLGGLLGYVWSDWLFVSILWVDEALRGQGLQQMGLAGARAAVAGMQASRAISGYPQVIQGEQDL